MCEGNLVEKNKSLVVEENVVEDNVVQQDVVEVNTLQYNALQENMQRKNVMENVEYTVADNGIANTDDNNVAIADETKNVNACKRKLDKGKGISSDAKERRRNLKKGVRGNGIVIQENVDPTPSDRDNETENGSESDRTSS
ncbi:hypothetical protein Tco_0946783 [Tanacetum coccineum]